MKLFKKYIFLLFMILFSCAVKAPPAGGLEDNKSPYILDVSPINGSFGLSNKNSIEINFNEMIDPNSIKSSVDIYPDIPIKINRFGKKIIIKPQDKWPEDIFFKIKIKRGIADYFGNILEKSKVLTYTTSNKNFSGYIEGKIYNNSVDVISTVAIYKIIDNELFYYDSIEDDINNNFIFQNIENGNYIVIGVQGDIDDIYQDVQRLNYGIYHQIIKISENKYIYNNIDIMFSFPDYRDEIIYLSSYNNFYGGAEFLSGEKVFLINDVLNQKEYLNSDSYILYDNELDSLDISFTKQNKINEYIVNNKLRLNKALSDSLSPKITSSHFDEDNYILSFSEPVKILRSSFPFYLINDKDTTMVEFKYLNPFTLSLNKIDNETERIYIDNSLITDYSNLKNELQDISINLISDVKNSVDNGGDISGHVTYAGNNEIIVELKEINTNKYSRLKVGKNGLFKFEKMMPGKYTVWAYEHINSISDYYYNGSLKSINLGAKFGMYDGDIEVRANWDIEGIDFKINE